MADYYCENCEFFENRSTDKLIDGYCKKYNQSLNFYDWWEKCDKCMIETLQAENAALRVRLENAEVEKSKLKPYIEQDNDGSYRVYRAEYILQYIIDSICRTHEVALACLAELKGGKE